MTQDAPSIDELLVTVREFVQEITPQLDGRDRYHAQCAVYLLDIVRRELGADATDETVEQAMLARYLGDGATGAAGLAALAAEIRSGRLDARFDELLADLTRQVVGKVRITRPDQLHPMHRESRPTE